jgi:hypothetical protein
LHNPFYFDRNPETLLFLYLNILVDIAATLGDAAVVV